MQKHIDLLGFKAEDRITGMKGVITSVSFDLFGCIQAVLSPISKDNSILVILKKAKSIFLKGIKVQRKNQ